MFVLISKSKQHVGLWHLLAFFLYTQMKSEVVLYCGPCLKKIRHPKTGNKVKIGSFNFVLWRTLLTIHRNPFVVTATLTDRRQHSER